MKKLIIALTVVLCMATLAQAYSFSATNGSNLSASADFTQSGGNLVVTLTNTSTYDANVPSNILTAVFFSLAGNQALSPVSATLSSGSYIVNGSYATTNVGGEWAYETGLSGLPLGATSGISSSGLGVFGFPNFNGNNLQDPANLDGLQFGILPAGWTATGDNTPLHTNALIYNSVVFTLSGFSGTLTEDMITNLSFQYGTALSEPNVPVPEPGTIVLLGAGFLGLAVCGRRKCKK